MLPIPVINYFSQHEKRPKGWESGKQGSNPSSITKYLWVGFLISLKIDKIILTSFSFCKFMIPMVKMRDKIKYLLFTYEENKYECQYYLFSPFNIEVFVE